MTFKSVSLSLLLLGLLACGLWQASRTADSKAISPLPQNPRRPYQGFPDFGHMVSADDFQSLKAQYAKAGQ
jgi:acetyl-CoA carboxylase carboxyltransferase component